MRFSAIHSACCFHFQVFKSSLSKVEVTFQNLDSSEISLTDVSHYFDSDPTKVVQPSPAARATDTRLKRKKSADGTIWDRVSSMSHCASV